MASLSTTSLKLDRETGKERVQRLATARRRSPHWVMREAVEQYVEREEEREQLRQDALAAWKPIIRPLACTSPRAKPMPGWLSSKRGSVRLFPNATFEVVAASFAGRRPTA